VFPPGYLEARRAAAEFVVWYDSWPSVELFAACATQWRVAPAGGLIGLDYSALRAVLQMRGVLDQETAFEDVRMMERGALAAARGTTLDELLNG
jgi:hypothetical protein